MDESRTNTEPNHDTPEQERYLPEDRIRRALTCTWHAFFARFPHLRNIQRAAVPLIMRGDSVIVNAPTAAGKTEAIMAPVIERYLKNRRNRRCEPEPEAPVPEQEHSVSWMDAMRGTKAAGYYSGKRTADGKFAREDHKNAVHLSRSALGHTDTGNGPAIILVAPTKALCNDLCRRLRTPVGRTGLEIAVRTGDSPAFNIETPPDLIITTPESLDSMIARHPALFKYIESLVIDEIHLVCASGRGDQLQCLIQRLKILNGRPFQICASSATVPEIDRIARDFLGENAKTVSGEMASRDIRSTIRMIHDDPKLAIEDTAGIIEEMLLESPTRKILAFCNSRSNVENIVYALRSHARVASMVFAHHGSLSKEERLRTEQQFLRAKNAACVATSTLELGIDIGDVDRILLLGPPPDVSSLIQRIGRGCRMQKTVHACCLADSPFSACRFLHLVECAKAEQLFPDPVALRPTAMIQQALSICLQNPKRWIGKQALYDRLAPAARELYTVGDCADILDSMAASGLLRKVERSRYVPESKTQFLFERGYMHSMINDRAETDVVDSVTGRTLGSVYLKQSNKKAIAMGNDVTLTLGGTAHTVSCIRDQKIFVKRGEESAATGFMALEPPRYSLGLAQDFAHFMHIPTNAVYIRCVPGHLDSYKEFTQKSGDALGIDVPQMPASANVEYHVNHFLGTLGSYILQLFFENHGCAVRKGTRSPFFMRLASRPSIPQFPDEEQLTALFEMYIRNNAQRFAKLLQPGPWLNIVPENIAMHWILKSVDVRVYARVLADKPIVIL